MATAASSGKPRFKGEELVAEVIEDNGARYIDVMDPDSGNVFRFYEVEYALACAMDGERDVAGIVKWAQEELGVTPTPNEVTSVIATLGDLGYLAAGDVAGAAKQPIKVEAPIEKPQPAVEKPVAAKQPAAASQPAQPDVGLARGVVVGQQQGRAPTPASDDFALGAAGTSAKPAPAQAFDAPDLALGKPGAPKMPVVPAAAVDDIPLGKSGAGTASAHDSIPVASDVSLDLSDNMKIGLGDVKEAVRASRVMSAVEVPKDLLAELEAKPAAAAKAPEPAKKPEPAVVAKAPEPAKKPEPAVVAKAPEPAKKPEPVVAKTPEPAKKPDAVATKTKSDPAKKPVVEEMKAVPPAPEPKTSRVLIVLLVLVILGGAAFAVYWFALKKPEAPDDGATGSGSAAAALVGSGSGSAAAMIGSGSAGSGSAAVGSAAAPKELAAKLVSDTPPPTELKPLVANTVEKLVADPAQPVKAGDIVALMGGAAKLQADIKDRNSAIQREQQKLDAANAAKDKATAANDKAGIEAATSAIKDQTASIDKHKEEIAAKTAELDKLTIRAPTDGKLALTANGKVGTHTADAIATLTTDAKLTATFSLPTPVDKAPVAGDTVTLTHKADGAQLACTVVEAKPDSIKVACDPAKGGKADDDVTLKL